MVVYVRSGHSNSQGCVNFEGRKGEEASGSCGMMGAGRKINNKRKSKSKRKSNIELRV